MGWDVNYEVNFLDKFLVSFVKWFEWELVYGNFRERRRFLFILRNIFKLSEFFVKKVGCLWVSKVSVVEMV